MNLSVNYRINSAATEEIVRHLQCCDTKFTPTLSSRVSVSNYAMKIFKYATHIEAWLDGVLIGLIAVYCNDNEKSAAYITSVSVLPGWNGRGIASRLMEQCIVYVKQQGFKRIKLQVNSTNVDAIRFYENKGFSISAVDARESIMQLNFGGKT